MQLTIGKLRGLQQCASLRGTFTCLALDHRQNLRRAFNPKNPDSVAASKLTDFKLNVTAALADDATAVLLDPEYSAAQAVVAGVIPRNAGLIVAMEATGYTGEPTARQSHILSGWSVEKAKRMGANAIKLLVYYHPNSSAASQIEALVKQVADDCRRYDLAVMLEPLSYSIKKNRKLTSVEKRYIVVETARRLTPIGVDILKVEFPLGKNEHNQKLWREACEEVSSASLVPWILLSAAADYNTYVKQVTVACNAGASGIAVGRAIWKEAVQLQGEKRGAFLRTVGRERLERLTSLCNTLGKPVSDFYTVKVPFGWHKTY